MLVLLAHSALAHTYLSSVYLNNAALGQGDCVRPHPSSAFDSPIPLVSAPVRPFSHLLPLFHSFFHLLPVSVTIFVLPLTFIFRI